MVIGILKFFLSILVKIWNISLNDLSDPRSKISFYWWIDRIFLNYINNFPLKRLKIGFIIIRTPTCVLMIRTIPNFITVYNILTETISNKSIPDNKFMHIHVFQGLADKKPVPLIFFFELLVKSSMLSRQKINKIR